MTTEDTPTSDVGEIAALARSTTTPTTLEPGAVVVTSNADGSSAVVDLRDLAGAPPAKHGAPLFTDTESLLAYLKVHQVSGTTLYADDAHFRVVAVIDDHAEAAAAWGDHRAVLEYQATPDWLAWQKIDGELMPQEEFALFVEEQARSIIDPPAADVYEMAEHFEATSGEKFRSTKRLANGQVQLLFDQTVEASAGLNGELTIPETITVRLEPFDGAGAVDLVARFRYRLRGGAVKFGLVLDRPDLVLKEALAREHEKIATGTKLTVLKGKPAPARSDRAQVRVTQLPMPQR